MYIIESLTKFFQSVYSEFNDSNGIHEDAMEWLSRFNGMNNQVKWEQISLLFLQVSSPRRV